MKSGNCRRCEAPIIWAITAGKGKRMPVDVDPVEAETWRRGLFTLDGSEDPPTAHYVRQDDFDAGEEHFASHFATCDHADEFRR